VSPATGCDPGCGLGCPSPPICVQTPHPEQLGPHVGSSDTLDLISSKDLASHLTDHDWNLFKSIHQVRAAPGCQGGWGEGKPSGVILGVPLSRPLPSSPTPGGDDPLHHGATEVPRGDDGQPGANDAAFQ